jgi:hypothetical protein
MQYVRFSSQLLYCIDHRKSNLSKDSNKHEFIEDESICVGYSPKTRSFSLKISSNDFVIEKPRKVSPGALIEVFKIYAAVLPVWSLSNVSKYASILVLTWDSA